MRLSIKQKQVLGVTSMVAVVVTALSLWQLATLARVLLEESRARAELLANGVYHQAREVVSSRETAYRDIGSSRSVQSALEAAIYSQDVTDAAIVDPRGLIVAASDSTQIGATAERRVALMRVLADGAWAQVRAVYATGQTLEWRQPIELADQPFAEIRIGLSTILVRRNLGQSLAPAAVAAGLALLVAVVVAMLLAQVVLRPIHVIRSGLSRLGRGDLGATLDLRDEEFRDLGDVFDQVTAQLRTVAPEGAKRAELTELTKRIVALGRLTAGVAHEVKNPLNAITIHLELLKQKLSGADSSAASHVEVIGQEIRRLDEVVQGFLKFARPEDVTFAPVSIPALAASVIEAVQPEAAQARVAVERQCRDGAMQAEGDATLLRQALLNLAQNALHAMPKGGRLSVACRPLGDGRIEIRVADTGVGIPPANLAKIFDLYYTTKGRGSGIGLSLVYRTVQLHNGTIDVESIVGQGTTFVITLPVAR